MDELDGGVAIVANDRANLQKKNPTFSQLAAPRSTQFERQVEQEADLIA